MKFEIGKKYVCRNGEIVEIIKWHTDESQGMFIVDKPTYYIDDNGNLNKDELSQCYYRDGTIQIGAENPYDIISEYDGISKELDKLGEQLRGDGGSTNYYLLPENATQLGDLIKHKKMEHGIGEAFCALYRLNDNGEYKRNLTKAKYYIEQELEWINEQI